MPSGRPPKKRNDFNFNGNDSDDDTWVPEENLDNPDMIPAYEEGRQKKEKEGASTEHLDESLATRKRGRRAEKKKKIEEIEKPRGIARGLQPEKILAAQLHNSTLYFLVKWQDCLDFDVVPSRDLNQLYPDFVIQYYESCVPFSVRHKTGFIPRVAPELPPEEEPQQAPMDISETPMETPDLSLSMPSTEPMEEEQPPSMPQLLTEPETQPSEVPVN